MSKKIRTSKQQNGTIVTKTTGKPEGNLPSFDVFVESPPSCYKKATTMKIRVAGVSLELTGRQFRTLAKVTRQHENAVVFQD